MVQILTVPSLTPVYKTQNPRHQHSSFAASTSSTHCWISLSHSLTCNGPFLRQLEVDLVGRYYNADVGYAMAFTTTMLSWSVIAFGGVMKGELQHAKEAICWATNYLLKVTAPDNKRPSSN